MADDEDEFEKKVGYPLIQAITQSLGGGVLAEGKLCKLIIKGMYKMQHKGWVERDTDLPFKRHLHASKAHLVTALVQGPLLFHDMLQQVKLSFYKAIEVVVTAFKDGGRFTKVAGQPYDTKGKHDWLHYTLWREFLQSAKDHFKPKTDSNSQWAYIAVDMIYRESVREMDGEFGKDGWCAIESFTDAYENYTLQKAQLLMRGDEPPSKHTPTTTSSSVADAEREREARRKKDEERKCGDLERSHRDGSRDSRRSRRDDDDRDGGKGTSGGHLRDAPPVRF